MPSELAATFNAVYPRPKNLDAPENLIALSQEASENYLMSPMVDEYKKLYEKAKCQFEQMLDKIAEEMKQ